MRPPFRLWPFRVHLGLALLCAVGAVLAGRGAVMYSQARVVAAAAKLEIAQERRAQAVSALKRPAPVPDFTQHLPLALHSEEVVRRMGRYAQEHAVQITSLSVERRPASNGDLGQSRFAVTMTCSYVPFKSWLAEILASNDALGVETLTLRRTSDGQEDAQIVLVLFTRD